MKKAISILVLFLVVNGLSLNASNKDTGEATAGVAVLSGKVTDKLSGEELAGVLVRVEGTDMKAYTGFEGEFRFDGLKPGTYRLVTSYPSYRKSFVSQAEIKAGENGNLLIELKPE